MVGRDGAVIVTCNPDSGSTIPLKTSTFNYEATDEAGSTAQGSFVDTVNNVQERTDEHCFELTFR
jgi:hypothetical protein